MSDALPPQLQCELDLLRVEMREIVRLVDAGARVRTAEAYVGKLLFLVQPSDDIDRAATDIVEAIRRLHRVATSLLPVDAAVEDAKVAVESLVLSLRRSKPSRAAHMLSRRSRTFV